MASFARLSIDITPEVSASGIIDTSRRQQRFIERAFLRQRVRFFSAPWANDGQLRVEARVARGSQYLRLVLESTPLSVGDRIVLSANLEDENGRHVTNEPPLDDGSNARLLDGAAMFVLHFFLRADPYTRDRLSGVQLPSETADVTSPEARSDWLRLRSQVMALLVEQEVRGPASLQAVCRFLEDLGSDVTLVNEAGEQIAAAALLSEMLESRASRRRVKRPDDGFSIPEVVRERSYHPTTDGKELLRILKYATETFGPLEDDNRPGAVTARLHAVSRGGRRELGNPR